MAGDEVQMDYDVIQAVSRGFSQVADQLKKIGKALEIAVQILRATAFLSLGINEALARWLEGIQKAVENLAKVCMEFSGDLARAITDHKVGDIQGKRYFGEGI
jgi:hypothetical protein